MSMVDEIADYLDATGHGTLATDLFRRHAPDDPDDLLCVIQLDGEDGEFVQNTPMIDQERPLLQVWARSANPATAETMINGPYLELMKVRNQVIGGTRYTRIAPLHAPVVFEVDENGRYIARVDFRVRKELSSGA